MDATIDTDKDMDMDANVCAVGDVGVNMEVDKFVDEEQRPPSWSQCCRKSRTSNASRLVQNATMIASTYIFMPWACWRRMDMISSRPVTLILA